ncbi:hypothetical protein [Mycolicibacterium sp. CBMA 334]|uniref:hypothetical protein n=1 Tax=Mycolicibacterium sp. CBMA 334 TaxID=2606607 RepID=UPI001B3C6260|nr:hypothetical protein [Mycolicibacterium sp. CBMA 334]
MAAIVAAAVREEVDVTRKRPNVPHRSRVLYLGFGLLGVLALFAIMAPLFGSPYVMHKDGLTDLGAPLGMFSPNHVFGTDSLGRDMLARSAAGLRATLIVAIVANVTSVLLGTVVGLLAGFFGSFVEQSLMRIVDVSGPGPRGWSMARCCGFAGEDSSRRRRCMVSDGSPSYADMSCRTPRPC